MKKRLRLILMGLFLAVMFAHVCVHTFVSARYLSVLSAGWVQKWGQLEPIVQLVKEDGPAATLRRGDEIVMLNGQQIQDKYQIIKFLETASLGTAYTVVVKRHGQLREFTLRTGATPLSALALIGLAMVLVPLAYLLSGLIVFFLRSESKQALLLALGFGTVYLDSGSSLESLPWWLFALTVLARVGYALQPAFGLHFFLFFPETSPLVRRFPHLEYVIYLPILLLNVPALVWRTVNLRSGSMHIQDLLSLSQPYRTANLLIITYCALWIVVTVYNYHHASTLSRRKMRLVLLTLIVGPTLGILIVLNYMFLIKYTSPVLTFDQYYWAITMMYAAFLLVPISFAYACVRHQVIPISLIIRRGVQYLLAKNALRMLLALPVIALVLTVYAKRDRTLSDILFRNSFLFYLLLTAAVAIGLMYRRTLRDWIDRKFFREAYDQDRILRELIDEVRHLESTTEVSRLVSQKVDSALHPEQLLLFYRAEDRGDLSLGYTSGKTIESAAGHQHLPADFDLLRLMENQGEAQDFSSHAKIDLPQHEKDWLASLGTSLIVPMNGTDNRLAGLLLLGPKKSEVPYTGSDRQLLKTLADQIAFVYENMRLKDRVAKDRRIQHEVLARIEERKINLLKECAVCGACYDSSGLFCVRDQTELTLTLPVERTIEGRYRLDQLLGKGGMSRVYEVMDQRLNRKVAVKILYRYRLDSTEALRRFEREAQTSAKLSHPNIVTVYDYGVSSTDEAYLVMELLCGETLGEILKREKRLAPHVAAQWLDQVLEAMKAAHHAGVIHRDLKPDNIFIAERKDVKSASFSQAVNTNEEKNGRIPDGSTPNRIVKILDFGVAKIAHGSESSTTAEAMTTPGTVLGTLGYMSPEQLTGGTVDSRSDIFSLGVITVETLAGRRPFNGKNHQELLTAILSRPFHLKSDLPEVRKLDAVLQRFLAKDKRDRFSSAAEAQKELSPAVRQLPVDAFE
jgi:eukaryotic-like serine/threonine-protein kinase